MTQQPAGIVDLATARASRSEYAKDWTPLVALKKAVKEIEDGDLSPDMVYVCMREMHGADMASYSAICAGGDDIQFVGLLTTHIHQLLTEE